MRKLSIYPSAFIKQIFALFYPHVYMENLISNETYSDRNGYKRNWENMQWKWYVSLICVVQWDTRIEKKNE